MAIDWNKLMSVEVLSTSAVLDFFGRCSLHHLS
jgi:hypothetical protein